MLRPRFPRGVCAGKTAIAETSHSGYFRGIRYSAEGHGRDQYVVAADASTGNVLWRVKVFHTYIKPWWEEDVQWISLSDLKIADNSLFVRDEKSRCYSVDLTRKHVKKQQCGSHFLTIAGSVIHPPQTDKKNSCAIKGLGIEKALDVANRRFRSLRIALSGSMSDIEMLQQLFGRHGPNVVLFAYGF